MSAEPNNELRMLFFAGAPEGREHELVDDELVYALNVHLLKHGDVAGETDVILTVGEEDTVLPENDFLHPYEKGQIAPYASFEERTVDADPAEVEYYAPDTEFTGDSGLANLLTHLYGSEATIKPLVSRVQVLTDAYMIPSWCDDRPDPHAVEGFFCIDDEQQQAFEEGRLTHVMLLSEQEEPSFMQLGRRLRAGQKDIRSPELSDQTRCADDNGYEPHDPYPDYQDV